MSALASQTQGLVRSATWFVMAIASMVLLGWGIQAPVLTGVLPGLTPMNPLTAVLLLLAGTAVWFRRLADRPRLQSIATALGIFILSAACIQMLYYFGVDFGIDRVLFRHQLDANRMALNTAVAFMLLGTGIALVDWRRKYSGWLGDGWPSQTLALLVSGISLQSLLGYLYDIESLYMPGQRVPMALNTAVAFQLLSICLVLLRPDRGIMEVLTHRGAGGQMARKLLPVSIFVPSILGWLRVLGQQAGMFDTEFGAALMVVTTVILLLVAVTTIAGVLNKSDEQRLAGLDSLARANAEISDIYNHSPCGYHSLSPDGLILAINDTELHWLGYARDEVVGKLNFSEFLTPASLDRFIGQYPRFKETGVVHDLEFDLVRKDGSILPVTLNATAIRDGHGNFIASRSTMFDATDRRRAERAVHELQQQLENRVEQRTFELAEANRDLIQKSRENEMFVYSVSHDLRSPLVNLQGFSKELALGAEDLARLLEDERVPGDVQQRGHEMIHVEMLRSVGFIQNAVGRLSGIINAILRLSRAGRIEYHHQHVNVNDKVARILSAMTGTIESRGARIVVRDLPHVWGDSTAVEQVFANLIGNAVNYLSPDRPGLIEIGCQGTTKAHVPSGDESEILPPEKELLVYYIKDNGLGIDAAYQSKVFQALKRLHPGVAEGEGIGLAIVRRIVERHGGRTWFESNVGAGSTFYVALPPSPAKEADQSEVERESLERKQHAH